MIYRITFFKYNVSSEEWLNFFNEILSETWSFKFHILFNRRKIDFYIESSKRIDLLNKRLSPFFLSGDVLDYEAAEINNYAHQVMLVTQIVNNNMFNYVEKMILKGKEVKTISFTVSKLNPFKLFPIIDISYKKNNHLVHKKAISTFHINAFLSFDLSNSISSDISKVKPVLAKNNVRLILNNDGILEFPGESQEDKISADSYDFWGHTLVIGQSGSGKSYFLKLMIENIYKDYPDEYAVVLVDPHASLDQIISSQITRKSIDFKKLATNLFININQPILSTELTLDLFSSVLPIRENQTLERVIKYTLQCLYSVDQMSLENLKKLITDSIFRKDFLKKVTDTSILQFFETEFQQLYTTKYETGILPIINLISELDFVSNISNTTDLIKDINNNFLVSFPVKQTELGKNVTRIIGGSIIQQIFTVMQAGLIHKKVILVIDEVSVVQTPSLAHVLSEARKFGLTIIIAQQYLLQVSAEILSSVFANTINYFCFKIARDDAEIVARNLNCEIDEYFLHRKGDPNEIHELAVELLTGLNPREVVARLMVQSHYCSPFKAKTVKAV